MTVKDRINELLKEYKTIENQTVDDIKIFNPQDYIKSNIEISLMDEEDQVEKIAEILEEKMSKIKKGEILFYIPSHKSRYGDVNLTFLYKHHINGIIYLLNPTTKSIDGNRLYMEYSFLSYRNLIKSNIRNKTTTEETLKYLNSKYEELERRIKYESFK